MPSIIPKIEFNSKDHSYKVNGVKTPCVSDILQGLGMTDFGAVPKHYLIEGRERGKEVHSICEDFDKGILKVETIDERLAGYFKGWLLFCKAKKPEWVEIELPLYNSIWRYCGTLDRVAIIGGKKYIVDIKTSQMKAPANKIQTALYKLAYEDMTKGKAVNRMVVVLTPDGQYKIEEHTNFMDMSYGVSAVLTYRWKVENGMDADIKYNKELYNF